MRGQRRLKADAVQTQPFVRLNDDEYVITLAEVFRPDGARPGQWWYRRCATNNASSVTRTAVPACVWRIRL